MLRNETVFIVGAGSSYELNLPLGGTLKGRIVDALNIHQHSLTFTQRRLAGAIQKYSDAREQPDPDLGDQDIILAIRRLRSGVMLMPSIDNFLHAHREDKVLVDIGKLAIAGCILTAERESHLFAASGLGELFIPVTSEDFQKSWFPRLTDLLFAGHTRETVHQVFENVSFVIFNYDRCLEHFLFEALRAAFALEYEEAVKIMRTVRFVHPYGTIGDLAWQEGTTKVGFGSDDFVDPVASAAQIKTFTESRASEEDSIMNELLANAHTVLIMGFGFIEQNVELLTVKGDRRVGRAFITTAGLSEPDTDVAVGKVHRIFDRQSWGFRNQKTGDFEMNVERGTCSDLMRDYALKLQL